MYPIAAILNIFLYTPSSPSSTNPLQDAGWVGVGVAIFVGITTIATTVVITVWAVRKQRNKKEIMYQVISNAPIVSINKVVLDKVEVRLDGVVVNNARLLVLKVWNSGDIAIKRDDYDEPITFEFLNSTIVSSEVLETQPKNLIEPKQIKTFLKLQPHSVVMTKFLLNSKESINLTILTSGSMDEVIVRGRIIDGKIAEFDPEEEKRTFYLGQYILLFFLGVFILPIIFALGNLAPGAKMDNFTIIVVSLLGALTVMIFFFLSDLRKAKTLRGLKFKFWK